MPVFRPPLVDLGRSDLSNPRSQSGTSRHSRGAVVGPEPEKSRRKAHSVGPAGARILRSDRSHAIYSHAD